MEKPPNTPPIPSWDLLQETRSAPHPPVSEIHKGHDDGEDRAEHGDGEKREERAAERDH